MKTFLLPENFSPDSKLTLGGEDFHYLTRVLRLRAGDTFSGTDRRGKRYLLRIVETGETTLAVAADSPGPSLLSDTEVFGDTGSSPASNSPSSNSPSSNPLPEIHLFQSLLKGRKMDGLVRQAVEAGVHRFIPVRSEYTIPVYDRDKEEKKRRRWEAIVREAVQQSGSPIITEVAETIELSEIKNIFNNDLGLFFHHEPLEQSPLHRYLSLYPKRVAIAIGPEGGFSPGEVEELRSAGFSPVHLHTNVLRAETAAVYALGAVQTIITERAFWEPKTVNPPGL
ncbi:MAG: RsmE family RNA methyltransferase [Spirochaetaceae bacterium]